MENLKRRERICHPRQHAAQRKPVGPSFLGAARWDHTDASLSERHREHRYDVVATLRCQDMSLRMDDLRKCLRL